MSCKYCDAVGRGRDRATRDMASWTDNGGPALYMSDENEIVVDWPDESADSYGVEVNFCPMCGRDLREGAAE